MVQQKYIGLDKDLAKGLSSMAKLILDAKVFGLIPDNETCEGWEPGRIQALYDQVTTAWEKHGHLPSRLPDDLRARHTEIFDEAIEITKTKGSNPGMDDDD